MAYTTYQYRYSMQTQTVALVTMGKGGIDKNVKIFLQKVKQIYILGRGSRCFRQYV